MSPISLTPPHKIPLNFQKIENFPKFLNCRMIFFLRMYCIDSPGVPESSDAGTFHCLYD